MVDEINKIPTICICYASDDHYAPHLRVSIASLICNRNICYGYDIVILHSGITEKNQSEILDLVKNQAGVSIRFLDITQRIAEVDYDVGGYWSVATNYRLLLFSDLFSQYDKILYLDVDTIVRSDISELYLTDMKDWLLAGVEDIGFRYLYKIKWAIFIDGKYPYNTLNYRTAALGMKHPHGYVNGGVLLIQLSNCRKVFDYETILKTLHSKHFIYNDQDVLNLLADGRVMSLDVKWNYQNIIEAMYRISKEEYEDVLRSDYRIIHYVGQFKPWTKQVELGEYYHSYVNMLNNSEEKENE